MQTVGDAALETLREILKVVLCRGRSFWTFWMRFIAKANMMTTLRGYKLQHDVAITYLCSGPTLVSGYWVSRQKPKPSGVPAGLFS